MKFRIFTAVIVVVAAFVAAIYGVRYAASGSAGGDIEPVALQEFALQTGIVDGRLAFVGVGGDIDGVANPQLVVQAGTRVKLTLINGDGMAHDFSMTEFGVKTALVTAKGTAAQADFLAPVGREGTYDYFCSVAGHRQAGMVGQFTIR